jgi:hypothetical protein
MGLLHERGLATLAGVTTRPAGDEESEHGVHPNMFREGGIESRLVGTVSDFLLCMARDRHEQHVSRARNGPRSAG